ncbi:MAG: hypothetical protein V2A79_01100 [Planctomycetota bacterium]
MVRGKNIRIIAAATLALGLSSAALAENLLKNPSFEKPKEQENWFCDQAEGWGRWGHWLNRETSWSPTHEGECLIGYHHWEIEDPDDSGLYQDVSGTEVGKPYLFSVFAFKDQGATVESIELRLEPHSGGGTLASRVYEVKELSKDKWTELSVTGRSPSEGLRTLIVVSPRKSGSRKGAVKLDDAALKPLQ